mmetsp:Transcript_5542/g.6441  ORF Transcript_5542/g.6441 Transcript_5542/m.6441 type:complete len:92 (-) Transcript_5542:101-376(-)
MLQPCTVTLFGSFRERTSIPSWVAFLDRLELRNHHRNTGRLDTRTKSQILFKSLRFLPLEVCNNGYLFSRNLILEEVMKAMSCLIVKPTTG